MVDAEGENVTLPGGLAQKVTLPLYTTVSIGDVHSSSWDARSAFKRHSGLEGRCDPTATTALRNVTLLPLHERVETGAVTDESPRMWPSLLYMNQPMWPCLLYMNVQC